MSPEAPAGEPPRRLDLPPGGRAWDERLDLVADDGVALRGALWRGPDAAAARGHVLLLQGRAEFLEKYMTPAAELVARGFAVASLDWRGQGFSQRLTANPLKGHVDRFTDYHRDLAALIAHPAVSGLPGPRLVVAHSMGATAAIGAALRGILAPRALVVTAPMFGIVMTGWQRALAQLLIPLALSLGQRKRWPPLPGAAEPYVFSGFEGNLLTGDRAAFEWMVETLRREPALRLGMPTLGWLDAAGEEIAWLRRQGPLDQPGLCLLGGEEAVVEPDAVRAGADRLGFELVEIPGARHELLVAAEPARRRLWEAIDRFLESRRL